MRHRTILAVLALAALVASVGCGGADDRTEAAPPCQAVLERWGDAGFSGVAVDTGTDRDTRRGAGVEPCTAAVGSADADGTAMTPDTAFSIGSVSKAFTAAAVLRLVDEGAIGLDDRAGDLVPGLAGPAARATVEELLLHTSGLAGTHGSDHVPLSRSDAIAALGRLRLESEPGTAFGYSNAGYSLLALVVDEQTGDYRRYLTEEVLRTADGRAIGGFWDGEPSAGGPRAQGVLDDGEPGEDGSYTGPHWALAGNGDLAMTMPELAAWTRDLHTGELLSPRSTAMLMDLAFDLGDGTLVTPGWAAIDRSVYGTPVVAAAGGGGDVGQDVVVAWLPEDGRVVALASNRPEVLAEAVFEAVLPALADREPFPPPTGALGTDDTVDADVLESAAGTYRLGDGGFEVAPRDGALAITPDGSTALAALLPPPDGVSPDDLDAHETAVSALLAGETDAGREERALVEEDLGRIDEVEVIATVVEDGEVRTYVTLVADGDRHIGWYAVDRGGEVQGADLGGGLPTVEAVPEGDGYVLADATGRRPVVRVTFEDATMVVDGPDGPLVARRR